MMKKWLACACALALALAFAGCSSGQSGETETTGEPAAESTTSSTEAADQQPPANHLEQIIADIQADFSGTAQKLVDEQTSLFEEVGDTFDGYLVNIDIIQAWYDLAVTETEALGQRANEQARAYYQAVVDSVDNTDDRELEKAKDDIYDAIYDDAYSDYYDAIYDDAFEAMYDQYYDGIISDAYDITPYDEWSDASSNAYDAWSDARSDVYDSWSDMRSSFYNDYSDVSSAFFQNDFDIEGLFGPVETTENA